MFEYSKNLSFDESLLESDFHRKNLEIGSLNLDDLNKRYSIDTEVEYKEIDGQYKFKSVNRLAPYTTIEHFLNNYKFWSHLDDKRSKEQIEFFISDAKADYSKATAFISPKETLTPENKQRNIQWFISAKERFKKIYKDYYPLGFLENDSEQEISRRLANLCDELDKWVVRKT